LRSWDTGDGSIDIRLFVLLELTGDPGSSDFGLGIGIDCDFVCCSSLSRSLRGACMLFIGTFAG
jgi:hypothetical protein